MKKMRSIRLSYEQQGFIYFTCRTFSLQPQAVQDKILRLCTEYGGLYDMALFLLLTTSEIVQAIALKCHVSPSVLYNRRKQFYEAWYRSEES